HCLVVINDAIGFSNILRECRGMIDIPVPCEEVVIKHVYDYTCVVAVLLSKSLFAFSHDGMGICKRINNAVQIDASPDFGPKLFHRATPFHEVCNAVTHQQPGVVARQIRMCKEIHSVWSGFSPQYRDDTKVRRDKPYPLNQKS